MDNRPNDNDQPENQPPVDSSSDSNMTDTSSQRVDTAGSSVSGPTSTSTDSPQASADSTDTPKPVESEPATKQNSFQSEFAAAAAAEPVQSPYAAATTGKGRGKRGLLVGLIVAAVLLIGGGAAAYALWFQNPERAVNNAIAHFASQKYIQTNTVITSDDSLVTGMVNLKLNKLTIDANVADAPVSSAAATLELSFNGNDYKLSGEGRIVDGDNIYFRINDIKDTFEKAVKDFGMDAADMPDDVKTQIENMQNKWVKVTPDDMEEDKEAFVCSMNAIRTHAQSDESLQFARDKYSEHAFITAKERVGSKDGLTGYKVEVDNDKLKKYVESAEDSPVAKALKECDKSTNDTTYDSEREQVESAAEGTKVEIIMWVTQFSHQMRQLEYTVTTKNSLNNDSDYTTKGITTFDYTKPAVETPSDSIELKKWLESLESTATSVMGADEAMYLEDENDAMLQDEVIFEQS